MCEGLVRYNASKLMKVGVHLVITSNSNNLDDDYEEKLS